MGAMAELNLAATRQENVELRGKLGHANNMIRMLEARQTVVDMEVRFIAAVLGRGYPGGEDSDLRHLVEIGRRVARLYVEAMAAEDAQARANVSVEVQEGN